VSFEFIATASVTRISAEFSGSRPALVTSRLAETTMETDVPIDQ
jgi:hypothetical protein